MMCQTTTILKEQTGKASCMPMTLKMLANPFTKVFFWYSNDATS